MEGVMSSLQNTSQEKLIVQEVWKGESKLDNNYEVEDILSDFENLDFSNGPFNNISDTMNYNEGKEANPFDKIAKIYGRNKNVFLFIAMLRDKEQSENIINIISEKCGVQAKENFMKRMNVYLERICKGESDAKEFLNNDDVAFFNGYHVASLDHERNIHANLNINITKPGQILETSSFFCKMIKSIEEEKSEVTRAKIYSNGKRIVTSNKNEKQQRSYSFTKFATCDFEISWNAKDLSGKDHNCIVVLNINSGEVSIGKSSVNSENVESKEILEFSKQNEALLIKGESLFEVLAKCSSE